MRSFLLLKIYFPCLSHKPHFPYISKFGVNTRKGVGLILSRYQRAYVDFFEDELVRKGYDWKAVVHQFLFSGKEPLISAITAGSKLHNRFSKRVHPMTAISDCGKSDIH